MKKYSSGSFIDAAVRVYGSEADTIMSFPATIIGNGGAVSPWTISGNMTVSSACGDKTANLFDKNATDTTNGYMYEKYINSSGQVVNSTNHIISEYIDISDCEQITISGYSTQSTTYNAFYDSNKSFISSFNGNSPRTVIVPVNAKYVRLTINKSALNTFMLNTGSTALPYEPWGYKIPIFLDSISYPIYISEPLRKTLDGSNLYDTIESNGTLTRRADSSGDALATPTTESIEVPTLTTSGTAETINIDTTLKPSSFAITYTGWHTHDDKKRSGGAWT